MDHEASTRRELSTTAASSDMRPLQRVGPIEKLTDSDMQAIRKNCDRFLVALLHEYKLVDSGNFSSLSTVLKVPFMYEEANEMLREFAARKKEVKKSRVARDFGKKILGEQLDRMRDHDYHCGHGNSC